ncbi:rhomboid family intramembrane serine protease [Erysipelothrix aquatica]|uniref:rhomboid family intramembrane serine protease n=1 Tax=Erysipelothrix aquatica TaxID=2683714 RepID=UPI0013567E6E|nr:rhomboid family intramembrane serine protease [Erysipelothrix aquatica]
MNKLYGAWLIELSNYLIKEHGYQMITMTKANDEIWLTNATHASLPIIMITSKPLQAIDPLAIQAHRESLAVVFKTEAKGLNISVDDNTTVRNDENVVVLPGYTSHSKFMEQFPNIENSISMSSNPEKSLSKAVMDLRKTMFKAQKQVQRKMFPATNAIMIMAMIGYGLALFLAMQGFDFDSVMIMAGGFYKPLVGYGYEVWRFVTSAFVHIDFFHLLLNLMILRNIATLLEPVVGWKRFLIIFFVGTISGNMFLFIMQDTAIGYGMAAGLAATLGALLIYVYETQIYKVPRVLSQISSIVFMNILIMMLPGSSYTAMGGGLFAGLLLGFLFSKRRDWESIRTGLKVLMPIFYILLIAIMVMQRDAISNATIAENLIKSWDSFGFTGYSEHLKNILS